MDYNKLADILYPNVSTDIENLFKIYKKRDLKTGAIVTRFAPSPTGYLHIGHFLLAFLDRLVADSSDGICIMRLEDTDQKRLVADSDKIALEMLKAFDINFEEGYHYAGDIGEYGPYKQSMRKDIYDIFAKKLVKNGRAYPCFCGQNEDKNDVLLRREESLKNNTIIDSKDICRDLSIEEIENNIKNNIPFALRLKSEGNIDRKIKINDAIKGKREITQNDKDIVLIKSSGIPVYSFAHAVDDTLMGTTLVIRGEEWYSSTSSHMEIFDALELPYIQYAHSPLIMKLDDVSGNKRKISKRYDPEANMQYYLEKGYPVDSVKEYLLNLLNSNFELWRKQNPEQNHKDFPFELNKVGTSNPLFDIAKLDNISKTIISKMSANDVYNAVFEFAEKYNDDLKHELEDKEKWIKIFNIDREGKKPRKDIAFYSQISEYFDYFYSKYTNTKNLLTTISKNALFKFLHDYTDTFKQFEDNAEWFDHLKMIALNNNFAENKDYKASPEDFAGSITDAANIIRFAITGKYDSPQLFEICNILGVKETKNRLKNLINNI